MIYCAMLYALCVFSVFVLCFLVLLIRSSCVFDCALLRDVAWFVVVPLLLWLCVFLCMC